MIFKNPILSEYKLSSGASTLLILTTRGLCYFSYEGQVTDTIYK